MHASHVAFDWSGEAPIDEQRASRLAALRDLYERFSAPHFWPIALLATDGEGVRSVCFAGGEYGVGRLKYPIDQIPTLATANADGSNLSMRRLPQIGGAAVCVRHGESDFSFEINSSYDSLVRLSRKLDIPTHRVGLLEFRSQDEAVLKAEYDEDLIAFLDMGPVRKTYRPSLRANSLKLKQRVVSMDRFEAALVERFFYHLAIRDADGSLRSIVRLDINPGSELLPPRGMVRVSAGEVVDVLAEHIGSAFTEISFMTDESTVLLPLPESFETRFGYLAICAHYGLYGTLVFVVDWDHKTIIGIARCEKERRLWFARYYKLLRMRGANV